MVCNGACIIVIVPSFYFLGSNWCWHMDGYDKLKPYGFPIHACIDGYVRKLYVQISF